MATFKTKPKFVEAIQWHPETAPHPRVFKYSTTDFCQRNDWHYGLRVSVKGGYQEIEPGDWIVGSGDRLQVMSQNEFEAVYEPETVAESIVRMIGERTGGDFSPEAVCKVLDEELEKGRKELGIDNEPNDDDAR